MLRIIFCLILLLIRAFSADPSAVDENEFAEFELLDETESPPPPHKTQNDGVNNKVPVTAPPVETSTAKETNSEDFAFLAEEEEFDQSERILETKHAEEEATTTGKAGGDIRPLTFADIPSHFRSNWSSYQVESIALLIILVYAANFLYGKSRNYAIALQWFSDNREKLEQHFALVGDDGLSTEDMGGHLVKDTDFSYSIWSTGRVGCKGMLTQIKLRKRQDLLGVVLNIIKPRPDRVIHQIDLERAEMDPIVLIFGQRKSVQRELKEMADLAAYITEKKNFEKAQLPSSFCVYAEIAETIPGIIDATTIQFLKRCEKYVEYVHLSDQYSGPKQQQDGQNSKLPEAHPTLVFSYILDEDLHGGDATIDGLLLNFTFYLLDKIKHYRLSREGKNRADRKRQNVQENFLKMTHQQRQEAAQIRREEKTRERKQKVMEEENPERQRRLEKLEQKRDAKQKQPRVKQFKVK